MIIGCGFKSVFKASSRTAEVRGAGASFEYFFRIAFACLSLLSPAFTLDACSPLSALGAAAALKAPDVTFIRQEVSPHPHAAVCRYKAPDSRALQVLMFETDGPSVLDRYLQGKSLTKIDGIGDRAYIDAAPSAVQLLVAAGPRLLAIQLQQSGGSLQESTVVMTGLARTILGRAWPNPELYVRNMHTEANDAAGKTALAAYEANLQSDQQNTYNLEGAASLLFAMGKLDDARSYLLRGIAAGGADDELYLNLGISDLQVGYNAISQSKKTLGLSADQPISEAASCKELRSKYLASVQEGIESLEHAAASRFGKLATPNYLNIMWRQKADLECGDVASRQADLRSADEWLHRSATGKADQTATETAAMAPLTPAHFLFAPMIPSDGTGGAMTGVLAGIVGSSFPPPNTGTPRKVRISSDVAAGLKISGDDPVYPAIARTARVQGTVVLQATISGQGKVVALNVISGPPMLYQSALNAVRTWTYKVYILNGEPVEVETTIQVNFSLSGG